MMISHIFNKLVNMGTKVLVLFETISLFRDLSVSLQSNNKYITNLDDDNRHTDFGFRSYRIA
ncbi:hypothetical protein DW121_09965 [Bacteroides sp. AM10-21B]|nr:hypothetical protein DXC20_08920 [Bacteroides sp. OM08-17BH]RHJ51271.1 hypothetical protein DW121_09965 [Bacteroides sp. AM10-21B]HBO05683.1 hypothetical protein [Bacteroides sp.]